MAWSLQLVNTRADLLAKLTAFACKAFEVTVVTPQVSNAGDGTVIGAFATQLAVAETITVACDRVGYLTVVGDGDASPNGSFSTIGEKSGGQPIFATGITSADWAIWYSLTAATWYLTGYDDIGTVPTDYFSLAGISPVGSYVAAGGYTGTPSAFGDVTAGFTVTGSVTGNLGRASDACPFTSSIVCLVIAQGDTLFSVGDEIELTVAAITPVWEIEEQSADTVILSGLAEGTDRSYVGLKVSADTFLYTTGIYAPDKLIELQAFFSYDAELTWATQVGYDSTELYLHTTETPHECMFFVSPRRILLADFGFGTAGVAYAGWMEPPALETIPLVRGSSVKPSTSMLTPLAARPFWGYSERLGTRYWIGSAWKTPISAAYHCWPMLSGQPFGQEISLLGPDLSGDPTVTDIILFDLDSQVMMGMYEGMKMPSSSLSGPKMLEMIFVGSTVYLVLVTQAGPSQSNTVAVELS